jgi:hypothetical protein
MKVIGSHVTEEDVEIALFFIENRHPGQAVGPHNGPEVAAGVLIEVKATSERVARAKLIKALAKGELT